MLLAGASGGAQFIPPRADAPQGTERFDTLALPPGGLHAETPIAGETITGPAYTRELIRVQWRAGDPIDLYIIRPAGVAKPPALLYLYGFPSEADRFRSDQFCTLVTKDGYAAVGFVSALTGQRYHDRPMKQWFVSELPEALTTTVHDVQMILDYLAGRGDFDMSRIGMFGQGSGGAIALLAAATDSRIKAVDVMDPWGDWPEWLARSPQIPVAERSALLTPAFLAAAAPLDPVRVLPRLTAPVRVQESLFNLSMPAQARATVEAAVPKATGSVVEYPTAEEYRQQVSDHARMLVWLEQHTRP
ncbi:MAG TPA: alpha/beta hydrolase [Acidobacteriaceae bacterium]